MKKILLLNILLLLLIGCQNASLKVNGREQWLSKQIELLRQFQPEPIIPSIKPKKIDDHTFEITQPQGLIRFDNNKWVYFISCSSHDGMSADIILAIDNQGKIFATNGQFNPNLIIKLNTSKLNSPNDLFSSEVVLDSESQGITKWVPIKNR